MAGHLFFLLTMFGSGQVTNDLEQLPEILRTEITQRGLWPAFAALCVSHGVSFVLNVLRKPKREAEPEHPQGVMVAPYGRVVLMHLTIIFGAMIAQAFGSKTWAFALLVVLKIIVDVAAHVRKNFSD
jgi:hypothetical protein